ncbi:MAG TPA: M23 family metallopeptidase, partial [Micromonosporaceae bacterium]
MLRARTPTRLRPAYLVFLIAAVLAGGCGDGARPQSGSPFAGGAPTTPTTPTPAPTPPAAPPSVANRPPTPKPSTKSPPRYAFPVRARNVAYHPTHAAYPGTDIFADCGVPVVAVTDGRILEVSRVDRYSPSGPQGPYNGGLSVSLLGDDGVRYYGSHLTQVAAGVDPGVRVHVGQRLGAVGRTGNASDVCHLHFGISPPCRKTGDWWIRRGVVWPASFLDAWREQRNRSPAATVRAWHRDR